MNGIPPPPPELYSTDTPLDYIKRALIDNYANFSGRSTRAEYWWFVLFYTVLAVILVVPAVALDNPALFLLAAPILALIIPYLSAAARRLHDTGKSGKWYFIGFVPYIGGFILLLLLVVDSQKEANEWGPATKYAHRPVPSMPPPSS